MKKVINQHGLDGVDAAKMVAVKVRAGDWDLNELMERLDGDEEFLRELLVIFRQDAPAHLARSSETLAAGDFSELTRAAHTLKGMLKNLAMGAAGEAAARLEAAARNGRREESNDHLEHLARELEEILPEVEARLAEVKS